MPLPKASVKKPSPKKSIVQKKSKKYDSDDEDSDLDKEIEIKTKPHPKYIAKKNIVVESSDEEDECEEEMESDSEIALSVKKPSKAIAKKSTKDPISNSLKSDSGKKKVSKKDTDNKDMTDSKLFTSKDSLQDETNLDTICQFIKSGYDFSLLDFNNFIKYACMVKNNLIVYKYATILNKNNSGSYKYGYKENLYRVPIISYFFKIFNPTEKQFNQICASYGSYQLKYNSSDFKYEWIDELHNKNYPFTDKQKEKLSRIEYPKLGYICQMELTETQIKNIIKKLNKDYCQCNSYYKNVCRPILDPFLKSIEKYNGLYPQKYLEIFILESKKESNGRYYSVNIFSCQKFNQFISSLIKKTDINESIYDFLKTNKIEYDVIFDQFINKIIPTNEQFSYLAENDYFAYMNIILDLIKNGLVLTIKHINSLLKSGSFELIYNFDANLNDDENLKFIGLTFNQLKAADYSQYYDKNDEDSDEDDKYKPKKKYVSKPIMAKKGTNIKKKPELDYKLIPIFELFKLLKLEPNQETLEAVCSKKCNLILFNKLTKEYNMAPDKKCLELVVSSEYPKLDLIQEILCYKIEPDLSIFYKLLHNENCYSETALPIINLFSKNGLKLSINEIELMIKKYKQLPDLNRFEINYDEKLYYLCFKYDNFPKEWLDKMTIEKSILELREMCRTKKITANTFREFLIKKKVKPDRYCLDFAIKLCNTNLTSYMFKELDCKPTLYSLYQRGQVPRKKFWALLDSYNFDWEIMAKPFDHIDLDNLPEPKK